jgi:hypothetical protein
MTTNSEIETRLLRAVAFQPSEDGLRWLDQRVAQTVARPVAVPRQGFAIPRLVLRPVFVLALFLLLAGAVAGGMGLLDQLFQSSAPGWRTGWDRAERLDLTQTDAGVTITLERAYADLNMVLVGFTVAGLEPAPLTDHGEGAPLEWRAELRDPTGRPAQEWAPSGSGSAIADANLSAVGNIWEGAVTPMAGTWELAFSSVGYNSGGFVSGECYASNTDPSCVNPPANAMVDGTWKFTFELPAPVGTVVIPDVSVSQGGATLTLTQLRITPTMIASRIAMRVDGSTVADWSPINGPGTSLLGSIRHGDTTYDVNGSSHLTQDPAVQGPEGDVNEFMTAAGSDQATGTWEYMIPTLTYSKDPTSPDVTLTGPWTLTVTVP